VKTWELGSREYTEVAMLFISLERSFIGPDYESNRDIVLPSRFGYVCRFVQVFVNTQPLA
jgi:hypothetical protein